jgi:hypothetical protein
MCVCVCVCMCVVCVRVGGGLVNRHAKRMRYIILSPVACPAVPLSQMAPFSKKVVLDIKRALGAIWSFVWNFSDYKKYSAKYYHKSMHVCMWSACYSCHILIKLLFSRQIFEKYTSIRFHENPSIGGRFTPRGPADGQTDTTKLIVTFRYSAKAHHLNYNNRWSLTRFHFYSFIV